MSCVRDKSANSLGIIKVSVPGFSKTGPALSRSVAINAYECQ
jgi:hypothetical protein